jgi:capsular exopolysaccharide synthesis family protein
MELPHNSQHSPFHEDDTIDIKRYLSLFISNWYWFAIALFISLSTAYGVNRYSEKIYTVSSTLLIKDDKMGSGGQGLESFMPGAGLFQSRQNLNNEIGILRSFALNKRVIDSLPEFRFVYVGVGRRNIAESRIYKNSPFVVIPVDSVPQSGNKISLKILSEEKYELEINGGVRYKAEKKFGERFDQYGFNFIIELSNPDTYIYDSESSNKYLFWFPSTIRLANQYRSRLITQPISEEASVLTLSLTGPVAAQEADYLNKLMELYIQQGVELKQVTADSTIAFIDRQVAVIDDSLIMAEKELMRFRDNNRLIDLSREGSMIQTKLEEYESEKTRTNLQLRYYEYLRNYLLDRSNIHDLVSPSAMGVIDPQLIRLVQEMAVLQQQKRHMLMNLQQNTAPLELLELSLQRTRDALREIVEGGTKTLTSTLEDINRRITDVEYSISLLPATEREFIRIQRKFDINNTVYTYLLEKRAEAGIAKASTVSDNRIIDRAFAFNSSQVSPLIRRNYMIAFILGLFFPVGGILLIDYLNNRIMDKKDVEKGTRAPVIGYISHNAAKSELPVHEKPGSTLAESFRAVRTNLRFFTKEISCPVIAISSTISAEGKTFISINLATIIASLGKRVLLVGLDLRKPRIHRVLGSDNSIGLSTYLSGSNSFEEVIQTTKIDNLWYAPAGPVPPNPAELIELDHMKTFLETARKQFDYVIIDTPPVAIVTDALLIAPHVDLYMLVVRQRYTSKNTLALIEELNKNGTLKSLSIVINDISMTGYYGYGLRYGYNMGYGYSYGYNYYNQQGYGAYGYKDAAKGYYTEE